MRAGNEPLRERQTRTNSSEGTLPREVVIREVGPRDGLQAEAPIAPHERARIVNALIAAGCRRIEAVSFVSPRAVPAMADPGEVLTRIERQPDTTITVLVPNRKGAERALEHEIDELTVTIAASAAYNERNVNRTIADSLAEVEEICTLAGTKEVPVDAVVSCAFGSPYEGDIAPEEVAALAARLTQAGASVITLADTTGMATPRVLAEVLRALDAADTLTQAPGLHLHETRGTGLLNAYAGLQYGITRFDCSVGGLGGSPFAHQAAGNLATEDFVAVLDDLDIQTGIDLEQLLQVTQTLSDVLGHPVASRVSTAGPRLARPTGNGNTTDDQPATPDAKA